MVDCKNSTVGSFLTKAHKLFILNYTANASSTPARNTVPRRGIFMPISQAALARVSVPLMLAQREWALLLSPPC